MARKKLRATATEMNALLLGIAAFILMAMVGLGYQEWIQYTLARATGLHALDVLDSVEDLRAALVDAEAAERAFLLTGEDRYLDPYHPAIQAAPAELARLNRLLTPSRGQPDPAVARLNALVNRKLTQLNRAIDLRRMRGMAPALEMALSDEGQRDMRQIRELCAAIQRRADMERNEVRTQALAANRGAVLVTTVGSLILLAFFVVGGITINRAILARERALTDAGNARDSLKTTIESIGDAVVSTDAKGRIVFANRVALELLRVPEAETLGRHLDDVLRMVDESTRATVERPVTKVLQGDAPVGSAQPTLLIARDGTEYPIDYSGAAIRSENGPIQGAVLVFRDITARRKADQALRESEQRFRSMADNAPVMIWVADLHRKATWFNRSWLDFTGRALDQQTGDGWVEGVHPDDREKCLAVSGEAFERRDPFQLEYRLRRCDGQWRWSLHHGVPLRQDDGTSVGYIGSSIDIHERKQAEETLRNTNEALQEFADIVDPAAVIVRDIEDRIIRWTSGAQALYGFTAAEALGRNAHALFHSEFAEPLDRIRARLFAAGRWEGEIRQELSNGEPVIVSSIWALHRRQGEPAAILSVDTDITARKRLEEEIRLKAEELQAYLDATPALVWIAHDTDCRLITGNRTANRLLGVPDGANVSQASGPISPVPVKHFKPDGSECRPDELPMQQAIALHRTVDNIELELELPDGRRIPVAGIAAPLFDSGGNVRGCVAVFLDMTERRRADERFRLAVEAAPNGMVLTNEEETILLVNSEMERLFGYSREEMMGQPLGFLVPGHHTADHPGNRESRDLRGRRKGGEEFPVEIALNPIETSLGRLVLSAIVDVTERQRMEQERLEFLAKERALATELALRETQAELARIARALSIGELAASIAHEINQPLAGVVTNAEAGMRWLKNKPPALQEAIDSLALIVRDGNRASAVIRRIRDFLKKEPPQASSLDMNEVIREALALAGDELVKRGVAARVSLSEDLPPARGDRIQLQQVVLNLIMNGAEAMDSRDGQRELRLASERSADGGILISVRDSGAGIDPGHIQRMFDAFFTTKAGGMGMGLSISRSIVEAHGGQILAEPNDGPGLTVKFRLPAGSTLEEAQQDFGS